MFVNNLTFQKITPELFVSKINAKYREFYNKQNPQMFNRIAFQNAFI